MADKPVYSTGARPTGKETKETRSSYSPSSGPCKMRLETKGRGGKAVTVLFNLPFPEADAVRLMKEMQAGFGCGGSFKDAEIELRGDVRDRVDRFFAQKGLKVVRAGG